MNASRVVLLGGTALLAFLTGCNSIGIGINLPIGRVGSIGVGGSIPFPRPSAPPATSTPAASAPQAAATPASANR